MSNHRNSLLPIPYACSALLLSVAAFMPAQLHAQSIPNVTGSITSYLDSNRYFHDENVTIQLQAPNFSLNATIDSDNLVKFNGGPRTVILNPSGATSDVMPLIDAPGSNNGTLTYNGATFRNLQINLNVVGDPATVVNSYYNVLQYQDFGGVASVPFLLTGTVSAYNSPPTYSGAVVGAPILTLSFSGGGIYSASGGGGFGPGANGIYGNATYQFLANPIDFHTDTVTQGTWSGQYGGEGYLLANGPIQLPGYAAVSVTQASTYAWATQTSDPRALQNGFNATPRFAEAYTGSNFNINIRPTDTNPHTVALYLVDFDNSGRTETLTVTNADTGAVLDTETISNFQNGLYAIWNLEGNIRINVQGYNGSSAVVSGIFFGPPAVLLNPPVGGSASAVFLGTNTKTQGAWESYYGALAYSIPGGPSASPGGPTVSVTGALPYIWAAQTTDPRALELNPQGTSGIASAYTQYATKSFQITLDTSSALSVMNLYLLDWDNAGRVETITITDLASGSLLDTETASSFQGGVYYAWKISGNVVVTITPSGSSSPVVSGIFLN